MEWKRRLSILGIVLGVYLGFKYVLPVTLPFLIGWLLAAWVYPLYGAAAWRRSGSFVVGATGGTVPDSVLDRSLSRFGGSVFSYGGSLLSIAGKKHGYFKAR